MTDLRGAPDSDLESVDSPEGAYEKYLNSLYPTPEARREFQCRVDAIRASADAQEEE